MKTAKKDFKLYFVIAAICGSVLSCKRAEEERAKFSLQMPTAAQLAQRVGVQATIDPNLLCYVVDIQGGTISGTPANTCQVSKGMVLGSVLNGGVLEGDLNEGVYTFKIYGLLRNNTSETCPSPVSTDNWSGWSLKKVYFLGQTVNFQVAGATVNVPVTITVPDSANSLYAQNSLPASCDTTAPTATSKGRALVGAVKLQGTTYHAYSRVNFKPVSKDLSGTTFKIMNWKAGAL